MWVECTTECSTLESTPDPGRVAWARRRSDVVAEAYASHLQVHESLPARYRLGAVRSIAAKEMTCVDFPRANCRRPRFISHPTWFTSGARRVAIASGCADIHAAWFPDPLAWFCMRYAWFIAQCAWFSARRAWFSVQSAWFSVQPDWFVVQRTWFFVQPAWSFVQRAWFDVQRAWFRVRPARSCVRSAWYASGEKMLTWSDRWYRAPATCLSSARRCFSTNVK